MSILPRFFGAAALALILASSVTTSAQSTVAAADAAPFMGGWALEFDGPQGKIALNVVVKDAGGKVAGEVTGEVLAPAKPDVADVTKAGDNLVLKFTGQAMGMDIPVELTLTPDAAGLKAKMSIADGQFSVDGSGKKK